MSKLTQYLEKLDDDALTTVLAAIIGAPAEMKMSEYWEIAYQIFKQRIDKNYEQAQRDWEKLERREG